jgi:hypothetical protein
MTILGLSALRARVLLLGSSRGAPLCLRPQLEHLEERCCPAIQFVFDYSLDGSGFFTNPQARAILDEAGQLLGARLNDSLTAIVPGGGDTWTASVDNPTTGVPVALSNLTIPANTLLVFAGGRNYQHTSVGEGGYGGLTGIGSSAWLDTIHSRGQAGALAAPPTAFAPWGGFVSFDTTTSWSFGDASTPPGQRQFDFLSVALHELGHILGIGTAPSWQVHVGAGRFYGPAADAEFGGVVPVDSGAHHWAVGTLDHGVEPDMTPSIAAGQRKLFTPLDWAALQDIGWQVLPAAPVVPITTAPVVASLPIPGQQTVGVFDPTTARWYLRNELSSGFPDAGSFAFGVPGWVPLAGDWDGNGTTTIGMVDPTTMTWYLRNDNSGGPPDVTPFQFGVPGWVPVAGDWNGAGRTGIGVFDPSTGTWYMRNSASPGAPERTFTYGLPGWIPLTGDWSGAGQTGVGVFDPASATWYLRNSASAGFSDIAPFVYGGPNWTPVVGDWNGDGKSTIGVIDPSSATWYLRTSNGSGFADVAPFAFGAPGWLPVVGNWLLPAAPQHVTDKPNPALGDPVQTPHHRNHLSRHQGPSEGSHPVQASRHPSRTHALDAVFSMPD